jgi:hypothetical protein
VIVGLLALIWATNREEPLEPVSLPDPPATRASTQPVAATLSLTPTPRRWNGEGFMEAFAAAEELVPTISLPDPVDYWHARGDGPESSKPYQDSRWQRVLLEKHDLDVFVQMDPYPSRRGPITNLPSQVKRNSFTDETLHEAFIADALQRLEIYEPKYMCLAMEINAYHEQHPADFMHFVTLFHEARRQIKRKAPETVVFVSLQWEQFLGKYGGQAGLPKHDPSWEILEHFGDEIDAIGLSSYPLRSLEPQRLEDPDDLPDDYYAQLAHHTDKPIIFAELGYSSDPKFGGSPELQAAFLRRLPRLLDGLDVPLINYNFLFDAKGFGEVFDSMGFITADGTVKPALQVWQRY